MRDLQVIIDDVKKHLSDRGMTEDLKSLNEEIRVSTILGQLYRYVGTWLITYQLLEFDDE